MPEFKDAYTDTEHEFDIITCRSAVFIRATSGGFWIYDYGKYVGELEHVGFTPTSQAVYRSKISGKRYWIEYNDYKYGSYSNPIGIYSE